MTQYTCEMCFMDYRVGSVFISVVDTDPADLLGYGTWEQIGTGKLVLDNGGPAPAAMDDTVYIWKRTA